MKRSGGLSSMPRNARLFAARAQRLGLERGVAVLLGEVIGEALFGLMQQVAGEPADRAVGQYFLVDGVGAPVGVAAVEQRRLQSG